jgi:sporulation protein YlmC with PRC-barrel domain
MMIELGRQVLDQQLVDRSDLNMGKVDGISIELREGEPPRIAAIFTGGHLFARRLHPQIERWFRRLTRGWGPLRAEPIRIPWSQVKKIGVDVKVDYAADTAMPWEHWVRDHIVRRIPGA